MTPAVITYDDALADIRAANKIGFERFGAGFTPFPDPDPNDYPQVIESPGFTVEPRDDVAYCPDGSTFNPNLHYIRDPCSPIGGGVGDVDTVTITAAPITAQENQRNLDQASAQAAASLGLTRSKVGKWTQPEMLAYLSALRDLIVSNPWSFTGETVAIAQRMNLDRANYAAEAGRDGEGYISPNAIVLGATDAVQPAIDMLYPVAQIPVTITTAANAIIGAIGNTARGVATSSPLLPFVVPIMLIGVAWLFTASAARDLKRSFA